MPPNCNHEKKCKSGSWKDLNVAFHLTLADCQFMPATLPLLSTGRKMEHKFFTHLVWPPFCNSVHLAVKCVLWYCVRGRSTTHQIPHRWNLSDFTLQSAKRSINYSYTSLFGLIWKQKMVSSTHPTITHLLFLSFWPSVLSAPSFTECGEKLSVFISSLLWTNSSLFSFRSLRSELWDVKCDSFWTSGNVFALCPSGPSSTSIFCPESSLRATAVLWYLSSVVISSEVFTSFEAPSTCNFRSSASNLLIIVPSLSAICCMSACILTKASLNRSEQVLFSSPETDQKYSLKKILKIKNVFHV